jgi:hypothetical protein
MPTAKRFIYDPNSPIAGRLPVCLPAIMDRGRFCPVLKTNPLRCPVVMAAFPLVINGTFGASDSAESE